MARFDERPMGKYTLLVVTEGVHEVDGQKLYPGDEATLLEGRLVALRRSPVAVSVTLEPMRGPAAGSCTWGPDAVTFTHEAEQVSIKTRSH